MLRFWRWLTAFSTGFSLALLLITSLIAPSLPFGNLLAYTKLQDLQGVESEIMIRNLDRNERSILALPPLGQNYGWSAAGHFVFATNEENNAEIVLWDGVHYQNISQHPSRDLRPSISRDGRVAFLSDRDSQTGQMGIYVWDQGNLTRVSPPTGEYYDYPIWSADGRLAFVEDRRVLHIWDGAAVTKIYEVSYGLQNPAWSADGRIAFIVWQLRFNGAELRVWDQGEVIVVAETATPARFAWSADGRLAYVSAGPIYIWDGQVSRSIRELGETAFDVGWHPDGRLLFTQRLGASRTVFTLYAWDGQQISTLLVDHRITALQWLPQASAGGN